MSARRTQSRCAPALIAAALLMSCSGDPNFVLPAHGTGPELPVVLDITCASQPRIAWVWAQSTWAVLEYNIGALAPAVCEIQSNFEVFDCCASPPTCIFAGTVATSQQSRSANGLGSVLVNALTFAQIRDEIDAGRPVMPVLTNSFPGHIVVLYGYDPQTEEIYVCDPFFGDFILPYDVTFDYGVDPLNWGTTLIRID